MRFWDNDKVNIAPRRVNPDGLIDREKSIEDGLSVVRFILHQQGCEFKYPNSLAAYENKVIYSDTP